MYKINYILLFLCVLGCVKVEPVDYVVLSGNISNHSNEPLVLTSSNTGKRDTISLNENGSFLDTLYIDNGMHLMTYGKMFRRFYFEKGQEFSIHFDRESVSSTLKFSGKDGAYNTYYLDKSAKEQALMGDRTAFNSLSEADYKEKAKEISLALQKLLSENNMLSEAFKSKEKRNINYEYLGKLDAYERSHKFALKLDEFKVSPDFVAALKDLEYTSGEDYSFSTVYKRLVNSYYRIQANELSDSLGIPNDIAQLNVASKIPDETIRNKIAYANAKYGITYTDQVDAYYKAFMDASSDITNNDEITASYRKLQQVANGKPSPKFTDYENHAGGTLSLDELKGKYVYIDVWATWCGPCLAEIPALQQIEKDFEGKNIHFLSVSIDEEKDYEKWKTMVTEKSLGGIQVLADNAWNSTFITDYSIRGIPRFILLDPQGNIVTANAPRPSDAKLRTLLNKLVS